MASRPLRWGIVSCGKIASDFVNACQQLGPTKHVIEAVAARSLDSARKFADNFGVKKYHDRYEALAEDPEIDVIYIGSINPTHFDIAKMMLNAKKPVLCEKPMCMSLADTQELIELAKSKNVFLMEAMWARCNPVYRELQTRLDNAEVGEVKHAFVTFGVLIENVDRVGNKELGGGCMPDIGIYSLNFVLQCMGDNFPTEIKSVGKLNKEGVDTEASVIMKFSNNRFATCIISGSTELPNEAYVTGSKGTIKLSSPFWCTSSLTGPSGEFSSPLDTCGRSYNFNNSQYLMYEAEEVARCLKKGATESDLVPLSLSLKFAELIQTVRTQLGVTN